MNSAETFLHHCELVQPSEYLVTGGALMEFFMAFGSEDDSRFVVLVHKSSQTGSNSSYSISDPNSTFDAPIHSPVTFDLF